MASIDFGLKVLALVALAAAGVAYYASCLCSLFREGRGGPWEVAVAVFPLVVGLAWCIGRICGVG